MKGEKNIVITNDNQKETALEISFKGKGKIEIKTQGEAVVAAPTITLDGDTINMKGKKAINIDAPEVAISATTSAKLAIL